MKHLIIGSGGREHALGWKLAREAGSVVTFMPGNAGTATVGKNIEVSTADLEAMAVEIKKVKPDLVTVGPEAPLAAGIVDMLAGLGIPIFGPTATCARIETSKVFAKSLMSRYSIPTASYKAFDSASDAHAYVEKARTALVVKADGLAGGKGSFVTKNKKEAHEAIDALMEERIFGEAGDWVVIEERLKGEEASVIAVTDGERYVLFPAAQDHKAAYDGDRGPNTGGMGAYCPDTVVDDATLERVKAVVFDRLLEGLRREGLPYRGALYAGLIIGRMGVRVVEFNARFGDPETQVTLPVLDVDLGPLLSDAAAGRLRESGVLRARGWAVGVVLASGGYPRCYEEGKVIGGTDRAGKEEGVLVFHAGTRRLEDGTLVTAGGRVLTVTGTGRTLRAARRRAYNAVRHITFEGVHMRTDIGARGLDLTHKAGVA
jgi:phosphoribosylamine--glycine ligase